MTTLDAIAGERLKLLELRHLKRNLLPTHRVGAPVVLRKGRELISFACNDYLGLSHHPAVLAAACEALELYGAGAGASRLVSGSHPLYEELEAELARMKGAEAACVFGSGYLANIGAIPVLAGEGDLILADKLIHACMLDGAKLSGAEVMRFAHNSVEHCRVLLEAHRAEFQYCLILTETVFSMDGDVAPVAELQALAEAHDAWLMTDDAHGLGIVESAKADIQMGTLSKAAGSYGGYVCGSVKTVEWIKNAARSLMFSTGLPPASVAASIAALKVMQEDKELCAKPLANARLFDEKAQSAVVPFIVGEPEKALELSTRLEREGFYVAAIRPPTVAPGTARLRFAFTAMHTPEQIARVKELVQ
jgi:8-amino-7-oxononanoate synthase